YATLPAGINEHGDLAGSFVFSSANYQGFVRFVDHLSDPIADPNSGGNNSTHLTDINDAGVLTGYYFNGAHWTGFLNAGGSFNDITTEALDNYLTGINNHCNTGGYSAKPLCALVIINC